MRFVLDSNVLVSALLSATSKSCMALNRALREGILLLSLDALAELRVVLGRQKFRHYVKEETIADFLLALSDNGLLVDADIEIRACRDPKDDMFLSLAVSGGATHIITGDKDLLVPDPFHGIRILTPHAFLELP